ncbi:MAG: HNH endonuclease [Bacteroidota bacterium]|jgi:5-methylcytosine-specific restriction protein A
MNRKQFIESQGATCENWTWSWSFIDKRRRRIIFGEWDTDREGDRALILDEEWQISRRGRHQPGYAQAREHIRLVEDDGFQLFTFPMEYSDEREGKGEGPATIGRFTPILTQKYAVRIGSRWYASDYPSGPRLPEEVYSEESLIEGARQTVTINAYERNPVARARCLEHYGCTCSVCGFNFEKRYGDVGNGYIHVHHLVPIASIGREYNVDPITDLVPVCANCHAMIHRRSPGHTLSIEELRSKLRQST